MEVFVEAFAYATENMGELWNALLRHLLLVATALGVGVAVCVPLGVWTAARGLHRQPLSICLTRYASSLVWRSCF